MAFLVLSCIFLVSRTGGWLPGWTSVLVVTALLVWLAAYLPIALRRVYGGSRAKTALELMGLGVLYWVAFGAIGSPLLLFAGLLAI